ncbi:MAG: hypothetical protein ACREL3_09145 [Gemmatimonadales bacterium]
MPLPTTLSVRLAAVVGAGVAADPGGVVDRRYFNSVCSSEPRREQIERSLPPPLSPELGVPSR